MSNHKKVIPIASPAFGDGGGIPVQHTADGRNDSPPLEWGDPPPDTRSFALVCDDPDAPRGTFTHWLVWNVSADRRHLTAGLTPRRSPGITPTQALPARRGGAASRSRAVRPRPSRSAAA